MKKTLLIPLIGWLAGILALGVTIPVAAQSISGTVFEDVNYGGGAGRDQTTATTSATASSYSGSIGRPGAIVELYNTSPTGGGAFVSSAITNAAGLYTFSSGLTANTNYTVRVVNSSVTSGRAGATFGGAVTTGYVSGQVAVQTFRTNNGAADANRVGGEKPAVADGLANIGGGSTTLTFQGLNANGDNTQFVDNVQVLQGGNPLATNPIQNPSFEAGTLIPTNGSQHQYNPPAATFGWTFSSGSGIQANNSAFSPPNTTAGTGAEGTRAAFIQNAGSLSQTFTLATGTYSIRFAAANRAYGTQQAVQVSVNGTTVLANVTAATNGYAVFTTGTFTISAGGANFNPLTAQSVASVTTGATVASLSTGIDFGFSFDVVANTNDSGQGSLRQFIQNANALGNAGLAQAGSFLNAAGASTALPAGQETSIFMIPNGTATPGLRAGLASGLNGGSGANTWAVLVPGSPLDALTAANTALDASTQTLNVADSNPGTVGLGGAGGQFPTVGTGKLAYSAFNRPEVEVYSSASLPSVVIIQSSATGSVVRGFSLHGAGGSNGALQVAGATGVVLENNLVGVNPANIADPTTAVTAAPSLGLIAAAGIPGSAGTYGIQLTGATLGVVVRHNVVAYCNNSGIYIPSGGTATGSDVLLVSNELVQNGYRVTGGDNITVGDGGSAGPIRVVANLIRTANSDGLQFDMGRNAIGGTGYNVVRNNTFFDNGNGGASAARAQLEGAAILYLQRNGGNDRGSNPDSIYFNIINQTQAGAIVLGYGQRGVIISQNSTFFNGTPFNSPTGGNLGIDLITSPIYTVGSGNATGARDYGNGDGVTPNTGSFTTDFANQGMNYPVFTLATATGQTSNQVNVRGYVGSAPNQAQFAGAKVEIFTADNVPANNNGGIAAGDNQSQPHGEGRTYLTTLTADGSGNFSGLITVPTGSAPLPPTGTAITGFLTATAYLGGRGTSEFGPNRPIIVSADVQTTISGNGPVVAGQQGQFNIGFANPTLTGPVQADGVIATVQLPPGLSGVVVSLAGSTTGNNYNSSTGLVTFSAASPGNPISLASGFTIGATITYTQPASGPVTATAAITTTTNEAGQTANNTATATNQTTPAFDVATAISGPTSATAGNQVAYVVTTTNNSGASFISPASGVSQSVTLPAGATNIYVTGNGLVSGTTVTWPTLPALASGASVSQTVSFTAPATPNPLVLTASVTSTSPDAVPANNTQTLNLTTTAPVGGPANVFALIAATATNVAPGATGTFTITQGNRGPNPATGVRSVVVLPPGLSGVTFPAGASYSSSTGILTLPTTPSQASGAANNLTYSISFTAPTGGGIVPATVQVLATSPDPVPADNEASALITVSAPADVAVQITGPTIATAGQPLTYTVTTTDNGPGTAFNLGQTVSLPAGLPLTGEAAVQINGLAPTSVALGVATFGSGLTAYTYNQTTGLVTYPTTASLAPGASAQVTFTFVAPANGNLGLSVSSAVSTSSNDPFTPNNGASLFTGLTPATDVQVFLTSAGQVSPGNRLGYNVTVTNNGPAVAPSVATTVSLPTGRDITGPNAVLINGQAPQSVNNGVATYPDGSTYDSNATGPTPGLVTLPALTSLAPGAAASAQNTISYVLATNFIGTLPGTATIVVTGIDDFLPSNNTAIVRPFIVANTGPANPGVTLSASAASVTAGSPLTLTAVVSAGTAAVTGLLQSVQLPPGLTNGTGTVTVTENGTAVGINYDNQTGLLTLPPKLNVAANSSLTYVINISQAPGTGPLVATANINTSEVDSDPSNNTARTTVGITPVTTLQATISGPSTVPAGATVSYLISATNTGLTATTGTAQTVTVPAGATNVVLNGAPVSVPTGGVLTLPTSDVLQPGLANTVVNTLSFTAPGAAGSSFTVPTNLTATGPGTVAPATASQPTKIVSPGPIARNVVNATFAAGSVAPFANTAATPLPILPLLATAQGTATLASYTIQALPPSTQGTLFLFNGTTNTPVSTGTLTLAQAAQLRFQPAPGFAGNATFPYFATDDAGTISNVALYLIPVAPDLNSAYTVLPTKGGAGPGYRNGDVLAYVIDPNGAIYTSGGPGVVYNTTTGVLQPNAANGLLTTGTGAVRPVGSGGPSSNPTNALPSGVAFDPNTGQFTVLDRTQLPVAGGTFQINVTTTDLNGGTNPVTVTLVLGNNPLPVQLTAFTASATGQSALLKWTTASEVNNDYFDVERSLDGSGFAKIGRLAGQGSKVTATDYALTDASAASFAKDGLVYYRLRQVDLDGTATFSAVRSVSFAAAAGKLAVYPNPVPASAQPTLDLRALPLGSSYQAVVLDLTGRLVRSATVSGGLAQPLDLGALASGTYLLRVSGADGQTVFSQRLTKE